MNNKAGGLYHHVAVLGLVGLLGGGILCAAATEAHRILESPSATIEEVQEILLSNRGGTGVTDVFFRKLEYSHGGSHKSDFCWEYWSDIDITGSSGPRGINVIPSYDDDESTDGWDECACDCGVWSLEFNRTMYCWYESMTEAMYSCLGPTQVEDCEDYCLTDNGDYIFGIYDCAWAAYHEFLWYFGYCDPYSSQDSSFETNLCNFQETPFNVFDDSDYCGAAQADTSATFRTALPRILGTVVAAKNALSVVLLASLLFTNNGL